MKPRSLKVAVRRPILALSSIATALPLAHGCMVRDLVSPELRANAPARPVATAAPWFRSDAGSQGPGTGPSATQTITGTVRGPAARMGYTLRALAEVPLEGADVRLGRLDNLRAELAPGAVTASSGRYRLEHDKLGRPLFIRATVPGNNGSPLSLDAPVPIVSAREVTVDIDLVSHLMTQFILDRATTPSGLTGTLTPAYLGALRARLTAGLKDETALPDASSPTASLAAVEKLLAVAPGASASLPALPPLPSPSPLPSGLTVERPDLPAGPVANDPPVLEDPTTRSAYPPAWSRYLGADITGLSAPAGLTCAVMKDLDDLLIAGLDGKTGAVFLYLRDTGKPNVLSTSDTKASAPQVIALDGTSNLMLAGKRQIVKVTLQLKADRPAARSSSTLVDTQADVTALAADPIRLVAGLADGRLLRYDLVKGQMEGGFSPTLPGPPAALALDADGGGVALLAGTGALHRFTATGQVDSKPLTVAAGASLLAGPVTPDTYAAAPAGGLWRLTPPAAPTAVAATGAIAGLTRIGQYLFRLDPEGNLDTLALDP